MVSGEVMQRSRRQEGRQVGRQASRGNEAPEFDGRALRVCRPGGGGGRGEVGGGGAGWWAFG